MVGLFIGIFHLLVQDKKDIQDKILDFGKIVQYSW